MDLERAVNVIEALKISDYGIPSHHSTWPRVSLSCNNLISIAHHDTSTILEGVVRSDEDLTQNEVHILHTDGKIVSKSRTVAESSKLHPTKPIIALQAQNHFQVYNFESKNLLSEAELYLDVCFWKWADEETIILITENSVYQWLVFKGKSVPELIFKRSARLHLAEIVNCAVDSSHHWYTVTGLLDHSQGQQQSGSIEGITQVFSVSYNLTQCIEAHCTAFFTYKYKENKFNSTVMCAACRNLDSSIGKIHIIELGPCHPGNLALRTTSQDFKYQETSKHDDFPISIQADVSHSVVYVTTKHGYLFLAELESAVLLASIHISPHITFCTSLNPQSTLLVVNRAGQVYKVSVDWLYLIKYMREVMNKSAIADRLQNSRGMEDVDLLL